MGDRIRHDHPSIDRLTATIDTSGPSTHLTLSPRTPHLCPTDTVVRCLLDGNERFLRFTAAISDEDVMVRGVYDSPRYVREPGESGAIDRLRGWIDGHDLDDGRTVHLDVIEPGSRYGLRAPGSTATYTVMNRPSDSLRSIAESLERYETD